MTEQSVLQTPTAYVRFARKTTPAQYESAEASVSVPVELSAGGNGTFVADADFWVVANNHLNAAKVEVLTTLGVPFQVDANGNIQETGAPAAVQPAAQAAPSPVAALKSVFPGVTVSPAALAAAAPYAPACPICAGPMYDNRGTADKPKRNPKSPDWKCKSYKTGCDGVIWPPR